MKMKARRLLAFLLTAVMTFTLLAPVQADDLTAGETAPAATVESVTLPVSEKVELNSDAAGDSQWQIRAGDDLWVDISGANQAALQLSYSMVANLLTDGTAAVRCKTTNGDQVTYGTEYQVMVDFDAVPQFEPAQQPDPATLVISEAQAVPQDTAETSAEDSGETEQVNESEVAILQAEEAMQAAEEALLAAEGVVASESAMTDEQLAALEEARANYEAAKAAYDEAVAASTSSQVAPMMAAAPAAPQNEGDDPEVKPTYTITINYVFRDGTKATDPWLGEYAEGELVDNKTVQSPEVLGYEADQTAISLRAKFPNAITENKTITVVYYPALVNFTIKHYEQNVDNDEYKLVETETKQGYTKDPVGDALAKDKAGFYALLYDTTTPIAADGSTVVEIYYDRYYYLMTFDLGGGYGVEPIYARYGAPIKVGTPTRPGYTFTKWQLNGESAVLPATMPAENQNYVAQWQAAGQAKVTIVFWGENADDEKYSYLGSAVTTAAPGNEFTYNPNGTGGPDIEKTLICGKEEHTHAEACIQCTHTHTLDCYSAGWYGNYDLVKTSEPTGHTLTDIGNGIKTYTSKGQLGSTTHYYLELDGRWYCGTGYWGNEDDTQRINFTCTHEHKAECYVCGKEEHHHTESCYLSSVIDPSLWTFFKSDTVTVEADGSSTVNVYFDRTTFTLTFSVQKGWKYETVATITDKWGAEISSRFNKAPFNTTYKGRAWECTEEKKYGYALQTLDRMPQFDATFNLYDQSSDKLKTIYYYVENVGANVSENRWPASPGGDFTLLKTVKTYFNFATYNEEYHEIAGFTRYSRNTAGFDQSNQKDFDRNNTLYLYYLRNDYPLVFNNGYENVKEEQVQYQANLGVYSNYTPEMPTELYEPGSRVFAGWYLNPECSGEEYKLSEHTMPLDGLILYAKWVPVTHNVTFHLDDSMAIKVGDTLTISHGEMIKSGVPTVGQLRKENHEQYANEGYTLVGWFYKDETGAEKAFDPKNMPVNRDLDLYAKWSSNVLMEYTIHYVYMGENGEQFKIADDTTGSALAGTTKTFDAKAGSQLYTDYQQSYFPKTNSHSLTIDIDNAENNVYTFKYVRKPLVWYTVQYIDEKTGERLADDKQVGSPNAVVTETYQYIDSGWMPDAYQKRLVLAASDKEDKEEAKNEELGCNVIKFYYHKDDKHAPVHVMHMLQNIEGDGYTLYGEYTDLEQTIGSNFRADILTDIDGAKFDHATANGETVTVEQGATQVTANLNKEGLELILYYNRIEYPYEFKFVDKETGNEIGESVKGTARYGAQMTQNALAISGYALAEGEPNSKAIVIQKVDGSTAEKNVAIFYYVKSTASLTIKKSTSGSNYCGEPFLFHITGDGVDLDVLVPGNGSVTINDLQVGETYTVTEDESWAWRYTVATENDEKPDLAGCQVTITANGSTIIFSNKADNNKWFDHTTSAENQWSNGKVSQVAKSENE